MLKMDRRSGKLNTDMTNHEDEFEASMRAGSPDALAEAFSAYRERLGRIVSFRLDYRLAGRISESDVLQETYLAAVKRLEQFSREQEMSPFLWLRLLVNQQLTDLQRRHIAGKRDVRKEVSLHAQAPGAQTSVALAAQLVGKATGASAMVRQAERIERLEAVLNTMDDIDREVIALRHFEELTNVEAAKVLSLEPSAASKRYVRAMSRLAALMQQHPDLAEG